MKELEAKDVMTPEVLTVGEGWLIDRLAEFLIDNGISGAPVVSEDGKLIGVVSVTDIVRFNSLPVRDTRESDPHDFYNFGPALQLAHEELQNYHLDDNNLVCVRDIMTPVIFNVVEGASIRQIADTMIRGRIHRLFVTREEAIVGVVSALDLLRVVRDA